MSFKVELAEPSAPRGQPRPWRLEATDTLDGTIRLHVVGPTGVLHGGVEVTPADLADWARNVLRELEVWHAQYDDGNPCGCAR